MSINIIRSAEVNPAGQPVPNPAPDYAATIRAPNPTAAPNQPAEEREVPTTPQDLLHFTAYMTAVAHRDATAITAGEEPIRLMNLIIQSDGIEQCYIDLVQAVTRMTTTGKLLNPTQQHSIEASKCLEQELDEIPNNHYAATPPDIKVDRVADFIENFAAANNPTTERTAIKPSPENMKFWRASRQWYEHCYQKIPELAAQVSTVDDPLEASEIVRLASTQTVQCLIQTEQNLADTIREQNPNQ